MSNPIHAATTTVGGLLSPQQPRVPKRPIEPKRPKKEHLEEKSLIFELFEDEEISYDQMDFANIVMDKWPVRGHLSFEMYYDDEDDLHVMKMSFKVEKDDPEYDLKLKKYTEEMKEYTQQMIEYDNDLKKYKEDLNVWEKEMNEFNIQKCKKQIAELENRIRRLQT